jgi:hypothetical protein
MFALGREAKMEIPRVMDLAASETASSKAHIGENIDDDHKNYVWLCGIRFCGCSHLRANQEHHFRHVRES